MMQIQIDKNVNRLWGFETLGIAEEDEVHESLKDFNVFNGNRYSVKLLWKEGHILDYTNYSISLRRFKGQLVRLKR